MGDFSPMNLDEVSKFPIRSGILGYFGREPSRVLSRIMKINEFLASNPELRIVVRAGNESMNNEIKGFATSETENMTEWLDGGELLLTTGLQIPAHGERGAKYVRGLHKNGIAALGFGVGIRHDEIPASVVSEALRLDLPLLEVSRELPFSRVSRALFTGLNNEWARVLEDGLVVLEQLTSIIIEHEDCIQQLVDHVGMILDAQIVLFDQANAQILARHEGPRFTEKFHRCDFQFEDHQFPLSLQISKTEQLSRFDRQVLRHLKSSVGVEYARRHSVDIARLKLAGDLISELEEGTIEESSVRARLQAFGLSAEQHYCGLYITGDNFDTDVVLRSATRLLAERQIQYLATASAHEVRILIPVYSAKEAESFAHNLSVSDSTLRIGVGRKAQGIVIGTSLAEARIATTESSGRQVVNYDEISVALPLLTAPVAGLKSFISETLGPILEKPKLLETLLVLAQVGGHWGDAANALKVHRHTLRYRANQITELTGYDLTIPEERFKLWLAAQSLHAVRLRERRAPLSHAMQRAVSGL